MIASPNTSARRGKASGERLTVGIRFAISALVLTAILLTALASSLLWWRTSETISRQLVATINAQIAGAVRKEVSAVVGEARAAHTAIRTMFLQNVLDTREADKREFVFLSQLQSQATISWAAFGWPDGSFFAAHKLGDQRLEMMEISLTDHPGQRRIDAALRRVIIGLGIGAVLAALVTAALARAVIAAPLGRVVAELRHVEAFALDQVRRHTSRLREIASLSGAIHDMAGGLSSFGKFIPADLVRASMRGPAAMSRSSA